MTRDNSFDLKLGRVGRQRRAPGSTYLNRVLAAGARQHRPAPSGKLRGSRLGRGSAVGALLASRGVHRGRRVLVKTRIVRLGQPRIAAARAHLRYLQRDGTGPGGERGALFSEREDALDGGAFLEASTDDRHQFRLIVSPEDGCEYEDLRDFTRRFVRQMEDDLGTKLQWVAAEHRDTGHPHVHLLVRGKDDHGHDLIIARDYVARGMRERAAELVTLDLGPASDYDIQQRLKLEIGSERLTSIDRQLIKLRGPDQLLREVERDPQTQALHAGRLRKLAHLGLARETKHGRWHLEPDLEQRLRDLGERGDIIRTLQRALRGGAIERSAADCAINMGERLTQPIIGRVIEQGLSDEMTDRRYIIVDALDGRAHYVDIGAQHVGEAIPTGGLVRISSTDASRRSSDLTIADIAARHDGTYSAALHLATDPAARQAYVDAHGRRLEALRRAGAHVSRSDAGEWQIPRTFADEALRIDVAKARRQPVAVELLSTISVERQVTARAATWLDQQLTSEAPASCRNQGFGQTVKQALLARRQWLLSNELAREADGEFVLVRGVTSRLRRDELRDVSGRLSREYGLPVTTLEPGEGAEGRLVRRLDLASGRFGLVERTGDMVIIPWQRGLDRQLGRELDISMSGDRLNWSRSRSRGIEI